MSNHFSPLFPGMLFDAADREAGDRHLGAGRDAGHVVEHGVEAVRVVPGADAALGPRHADDDQDEADDDKDANRDSGAGRVHATPAVAAVLGAGCNGPVPLTKMNLRTTSLVLARNSSGVPYSTMRPS